MKTALLFSLTALGLSLPASTAVAQPPAPALVEGNTAFALDLYRRESARPGNLFLSPHSISTALAMTRAGARGRTADEMVRTLHLPSGAEDLAAGFAALTRRIESLSATNRVTLSVANSLWYAAGVRLQPAFLDLVKRDFRAEARPADFRTASETARAEINSWVESKTEKRIRNLVGPGALTPATRLVLCNAIYFKGRWQSPFHSRSTRPAPFFPAPGREVQTPTMYQELTLRFREHDTFSALALPYAGDDLSMVILLPKQMDGLDALARSLDGPRLGQWLTELDEAAPAKTDVFLPKFTFTSRFTLGRDLAVMGMPAAFSSQADFSGIDGAKDLFIGDVIHQAFVEVSEEGTEAAAATAVVMVGSAMTRPQPKPVFRMDHPFLFLIRDNQTGCILFLGRMADPSAAAGQHGEN